MLTSREAPRRRPHPTRQPLSPLSRQLSRLAVVAALCLCAAAPAHAQRPGPLTPGFGTATLAAAATPPATSLQSWGRLTGYVSEAFTLDVRSPLTVALRVRGRSRFIENGAMLLDVARDAAWTLPLEKLEDGERRGEGASGAWRVAALAPGAYTVLLSFSSSGAVLNDATLELVELAPRAVALPRQQPAAQGTLDELHAWPHAGEMLIAGGSHAAEAPAACAANLKGLRVLRSGTALVTLSLAEGVGPLRWRLTRGTGVGLLLETDDGKTVCSDASGVLDTPSLSPGTARLYALTTERGGHAELAAHPGGPALYDVSLEDLGQPAAGSAGADTARWTVTGPLASPLVASTRGPYDTELFKAYDRGDRRFGARTPAALLEATRPLDGLRLLVNASPGFVVCLEAVDANGRPLTGRGKRLACPETVNGEVALPRLEPGTYTVRLGFPKADEAIGSATLVLVNEKTPLQPTQRTSTVADDATLPLAERLLPLHYAMLRVDPFRPLELVGYAERQAYFRTAPRALFAYPTFDLDAASAHGPRSPLMGKVADAAREFPRKDEPLLLLASQGRSFTVLGADGGIWDVPADYLAPAPAGAPAWPTKVRNLGDAAEAGVSRLGLTAAETARADRAAGAVGRAEECVHRKLEGKGYAVVLTRHRGGSTSLGELNTDAQVTSAKRACGLPAAERAATQLERSLVEAFRKRAQTELTELGRRFR